MAVWPLGGPFHGSVCPKWPFLGPKMVFSARNNLFLQILQFFRYHYDETPKRLCFCVPHVAGQAPGGVQRPVFGPKIWLFYTTPIKPPFFGLRRTRLNGIITSPYPEVTLDTFGIALVLHGISLYCMVLHSIAWCCIVLYCISLYHIKSYDIARYCIVPLLASARGLYLARHLFTLYHKH